MCIRDSYTEEKMEVGSKSTSVMGVSSSQQGGLTLDGMVQRLVQKLVWEIDSKHKGPAEKAKTSVGREKKAAAPVSATK